MSEKKFNVAMIGCGAIADFHLQGILEKEECELYAVCDSATDDRLERRAKKYGAPRMVKDYMELVNDPNVDIAIVATPDYSHKEIACAFLRAGKQVLLRIVKRCARWRRRPATV